MSYNIPGIIAPVPFTPVLSFGGGSTGITYSSRFAYSSQIIHSNGIIETKIWGYIGLSNKGSSTGQAEVSGFLIPTGANGTFYRLMCSTGAISATAGSIATLVMEANQTKAAMSYSVMGGAGGGITNAEFTNTCEFNFWGSYLNN